MNTSTVAPEVEHLADMPTAVLIDEIRELDRAAALIDAKRVRALSALQSWVLTASASGGEAEMRLRSVAAEIAVSSQVNDRTILRHMNEAWTLVEHLPATVEALECGDITLAHARVIREESLALDGAERTAFEAIALGRAQHETPTRLRSILRSVSEEFRTASFATRHQEARKRRHVVVIDQDDGMSDLFAHIPTYLAHSIVDGLTSKARSVKKAAKRAQKDAAERFAEQELAGILPDGRHGRHGRHDGDGCDAGDGGDGRGDRDGRDCGDDRDDLTIAATDDRTFDQIRADALCELLLGDDPDVALTAVVQITIPVLSLLDQSDTPATLAGAGPIDLDTARRLAGATKTWERLLTDPIRGQILAVDTYRPSQQQRRLLRARDERCRFPGCRAKPWHGDIDHSCDHAYGGQTANDNLGHVCRYHHTMKHAAGWTITQRPHGIIEWTTPHGRTYTDVPPHIARFIPTDELPPPLPKPRTQRDLEFWRGPIPISSETRSPVGHQYVPLTDSYINGEFFAAPPEPDDVPF